MNSSQIISYRSGQIQGAVTGMIIRKEMPRVEIEKSLEEIKKWAKDIHRANKKLLKQQNLREDAQ